MGLIDKIKQDAKKSGQNKRKFAYFKEGNKVRIRFLTDMDDGMEVLFHDSFQKGINIPCQEIFGRDCEYCEMEGLRTRSQYVWSVWNYEAKEVQLFMFPVNNCSPIPALMALYETYGTLLDRDYVISVSGKQQNKTFSVIPMDKAKFRNEKAKPYSEKTILSMLNKAFPADGYEDEEEIKKPKKKSKPPKDEDWDDNDDLEEEIDYEDLSAKELYKLCLERKIEALKKKPEKYYINLLKEYDEAQEDWEDSDDEEDDDWEDDDE